MADAAMVMTEAGGDVVLYGFDLERDDGLETSVIISLWTDRRATAEQLPVDYSPTDLRGYWGDVSNESAADHTGSLLWLLSREKQLPKVLASAEQYCRDALAWMIDDKVATKIEVAAEFYGTGVMLLVIDIYRPSGAAVRYRYQYEWAAQALKRVA